MEHCLVPIGLAALNEQSRLPLRDELTDKIPAAGLTILEAEASGDLLGGTSPKGCREHLAGGAFCMHKAVLPWGEKRWRLEVRRRWGDGIDFSNSGC